MTNPTDNEKTDSLTSTLTAIVNRLKDHPALLFSFGMAIILLAAGTLVLENLRLILGGVLVLAVMGFAAWVLIENRKASAEKQSGVSAKITRTGAVKIGKNTKVKEKLGTGSINIKDSKGNFETGDIVIGDDAEIKGQIYTGNINQNNKPQLKSNNSKKRK